jgi:predicted secreted protein
MAVSYGAESNSKGMSGFGTVLVSELTAVGEIGEIQKINIDGVDITEIDITTMRSPGAWREFVAGLKDAKQMTLDLLFAPVNAKLIMDQAGIRQYWTVYFPPTSSGVPIEYPWASADEAKRATYTQRGFIKGYSIATPHDDKISQSVTIRLLGLPVFTIPAGA